MSTQNRRQINELMTHIEELWGHLETLFDDLTANDGWGGKHGADWTFADVPYHLAYCNQDIVIRGLENGTELAQEKQELLASTETLNAWNARKFAARPAGQTAAQSVAQPDPTLGDPQTGTRKNAGHNPQRFAGNGI